MTTDRGLLLITGGAGFIGSHTARLAIERGWRVRVLDNLSAGSREALRGLDLELLEADIRDPDAVQASFADVTHVVHLAARISVPESCEDPLGYDEVNCAGTVRIMEAARQHGCRTVVYASSAAVYGSLPGMPKSVRSPVSPESPYASQKLANEAYGNAYAALSGVTMIGLRYFNVFGPGQDPDGPYGAVIPTFVRRAVRGEHLVVHGDGMQTRDFVSVFDVARANVMALSASTSGVYNIGVGRGLSVKRLAEIVAHEVGGALEIRHREERPGDVKHSVSSIEETTAALGWRPEAQFERALRATIRYFRDQDDPRE